MEVWKSLLKCIELMILAGQSSVGGNIDNEHNVTAVRRQVDLLIAVDIRNFEVEDRLGRIRRRVAIDYSSLTVDWAGFSCEDLEKPR
ncbi:hypothetical protein CHS0354_032070 [Potamilus streckersoni]|uniref:Uncharacterized protein n=1 Tax=Potamilus streckersoni TaxID=2493646 RepID=A0AAE0TL74_9BIVA|nr:hypothetical protein CHS0354_032070 [Potamilus streckersoni]